MNLIDSELLDNLTNQARSNPRLRQNYDLRNSVNDKSQRMLNALEPGTIVPIHRHQESTETVAILRGSVRQLFFDDEGRIIRELTVSAGSDCPFYIVGRGEWHKTECLESGTIVFEAKDGAYEPQKDDDILLL